jgi:hypothetical protein
VLAWPAKLTTKQKCTRTGETGPCGKGKLKIKKRTLKHAAYTSTDLSPDALSALTDFTSK